MRPTTSERDVRIHLAAETGGPGPAGGRPGRRPGGDRIPSLGQIGFPIDPAFEWRRSEQIADWRAQRDQSAVGSAQGSLVRAVAGGGVPVARAGAMILEAVDAHG